MNTWKSLLRGVCGLLLTGILVLPSWGGDKLNVLFLAVDDLRPELGCYGVERVQSPHIDALAASGFLFERAYCQQAVCSPSRTSLMTGLRPDSTRVYDLDTHFRDTVPEVVTVAQHFMQHGYRSVGLGKIYHGSLNDVPSWDEYDACSGMQWVLPENLAIREHNRKAAKAKKLTGKALRRASNSTPVERGTGPVEKYADSILTRTALARLNELAGSEEPFFLAVGYRRPHLPFNAPAEFWDRYDRKDLALSPVTDWPRGAPSMARTNWGELRTYHGMPAQGPVTADQARELQHGYLACVSYVDDGIGQLLAELERLGQAEKTIVILWGDHGWKLSEYGAWCKHTNYDIDVHVPLIVRYPGMPSPGGRSSALVEYVDMYPSLCELAGLPLPAHLEGTSFVPVVEQPDRPWKAAAFSQYPRGGRGTGPLMGYSMRTDRYRLVAWMPRGKPGAEPVAVELYDHREDPRETVNLAQDPARADEVKQLVRQCQAGWKAARPGAKESP